MAAALAHAASGLAAVTGEHYAGGHWLGSFAIYLDDAQRHRQLIRCRMKKRMSESRLLAGTLASVLFSDALSPRRCDPWVSSASR